MAPTTSTRATRLRINTVRLRLLMRKGSHQPIAARSSVSALRRSPPPLSVLPVDRVWLVFGQTPSGDELSGVFGNAESADAYAEQIAERL